MNTLPSACPCASTSGDRQLRDLGHPEARDVQGPQQLLWATVLGTATCVTCVVVPGPVWLQTKHCHAASKPPGARATVTQRLCTIAGFYKYAVEEELGAFPAGACPPSAAGHSHATDRAIGDRCEGPIFITLTVQRLEKHGLADRPAGRPRRGLAKKIGSHTLRRAFITAALEAGIYRVPGSQRQLYCHGPGQGGSRRSGAAGRPGPTRARLPAPNGSGAVRRAGARHHHRQPGTRTQSPDLR